VFCGLDIGEYLTPRDADGNWGLVESMTFVDETFENEIRKPKELFKEGKATVRFVFPTTEAGFATSCRTFFESVLDNDVVDRKQLRQVVQKILDSLAGEGTE